MGDGVHALTEMDGLRLVGADGCRSGWVVAAGDLSLRAPEFAIWPSFRALLDSLVGVRALVAIDIPIGLPSGAPLDDGSRRADGAARTFLGGRRRSSVFSAPCRPTLQAESYRTACDLEVQARGRGKGLSQQAYNIIPKIREVDAALEPAHQGSIDDTARVWVREAHPEVTFAVLTGAGEPGHGLTHSKRSCSACPGTPCPGESDRVTLLQVALPDFDLRAVCERLMRRSSHASGARGVLIGRDDIVDAAACLITAWRIARGLALTLPAGETQRDARGLRMEIVA